MIPRSGPRGAASPLEVMRCGLGKPVPDRVRFLYLSGQKVSIVRIRGVTTIGVCWSSGEPSSLVGPPLNLVLYMHLRIFAYTSNTLIASFEYMDCMLASGTLKNLRFLLRSCLFTERAPVMKLICSNLQPSICITLLMALRRDAY